MDVNTHDDFHVEPIPGLPEVPPQGENILWQGAPNWRVMARSTFHVRKVAFYFAILAAWGLSADLWDGAGLLAAAAGMFWLLPVAAAALALLVLFAWLTARTTIYTITSRRVVLRFGIALPMTINIPFRVIESAAERHNAAGSGDIALTLTKGNRIAYLVLWPHVRPWAFVKPQPMLRALPETGSAAEILARALAAFVADESPALHQADGLNSDTPAAHNDLAHNDPVAPVMPIRTPAAAAS